MSMMHKYAPGLEPISETDTIATKMHIEDLETKEVRPNGVVLYTVSTQNAGNNPEAANPSSESPQLQEEINKTELQRRPKKPSKYGRSPLHEAVRSGDLDAIQQLLQEIPELLRKTDDRGNTPLHYAANASAKQGPQAVHLLLQAGAFVNAMNSRQQTPLLIYVLSTQHDDDLVPRILLHHKARPRVKVTEDHFLPQYALERGLPRIASALREFM